MYWIRFVIDNLQFGSFMKKSESLSDISIMIDLFGISHNMFLMLKFRQCHINRTFMYT